MKSLTDAIPTEATPIGRAWRWQIGWFAIALGSVIVAILSARYAVGIGPFPALIMSNQFVRPWLIVHVGAAAVALLLAPFQFVERLRKGTPSVHRWMGRAYVLGCIVGGVAGLVLAFGASTGWISTAGFGFLAVSWLISTLLAWRAARVGKFMTHRKWMTRSFALTFAAVTLRLYLPTAALLPFPLVDSYRAISFLCWVPNLIVAEIYLLRRLGRPLGPRSIIQN